jgi:sugar/nucleoside kinase (ribokinase family)
VSLDLHPGIAHLGLQRIAAPGKMFEVGALEFTTGGAVPNTGLALHRLGVQVGLMTTIGDDLMGDLLMTQIASFAPHLTRLIKRVEGAHTPHTVVLSPQGSDRILWHHLGTNADFSAPDIDYSAVEQSKIFHLGYPPYLPKMIADDGAALAEIFRRVHQSGRVVTSLDTAVPDADTPGGQADWPRILGRCLPYIDIFLPSIEEIMFMMRRADYDQWAGALFDHLTQDYLRELADELLTMGCIIAGFKLGQHGIFLKTGTSLNRLGGLPLKMDDWSQFEGWHPPFEVEVVGAVGAGDAAYAGFLTAMLRGLPPQESLRIACAVGACNVEAADAISSIPSWDALQERLDAGWAVRG